MKIGEGLARLETNTLASSCDAAAVPSEPITLAFCRLAVSANSAAVFNVVMHDTISKTSSRLLIVVHIKPAILMESCGSA
jgi:hypothetical protein